MKIFSWNCNGIRAVINKGAFQSFLSEFNPDILGLQETKAQPEQVELDLPEYKVFWNSAEKKGYSGTALLSKIQPIKIDKNFPEAIAKKYDFFDTELRDSHSEGRILTAEYESFYFVTVYTPNSKGDLSRLPLRKNIWDPAFLDYVKFLEKTKPVIFCGDLNVAHLPEDLAHPESNEGTHGYTEEERAGFQSFIDAGFIDTFRLFTKGNGYYTWWTHWANARARNIGWRIDYFLVSSSLMDKIKSAKIYPEFMGSDHCPISIEIDI